MSESPQGFKPSKETVRVISIPVAQHHSYGPAHSTAVSEEAQV